MRSSNLKKAGLVFFLGLVCSGLSRADSLEVTLTEASQTVVQGTTIVAFDATISNPSPTDTVFLNSDTSLTDSVLVTVDDTPFFLNAPFFLGPLGSSGPFELFDVDLPADIALGLYNGTFSIYGGADTGASVDLVDTSFSVEVTAPVGTPEPGTLLLLGSGLVSLGFLRRKVKLLG